MVAPQLTTASAVSGETLDAVCWRVLGTTAGGVVEQALVLNPAHAASVILPEGATLFLPSVGTPRAIETVQLWN